jgi:hypothetical protein
VISTAQLAPTHGEVKGSGIVLVARVAGSCLRAERPPTTCRVLREESAVATALAIASALMLSSVYLLLRVCVGC